MKSSCKGCQERKLGCHSTCETYKAFRKKQDELNRKRQAMNEMNEMLKKTRRKNNA